MAQRGRLPKPLALHDLHGTYHAGKHKHLRMNEPQPPAGDLPDPPADFSDRQKAIWHRAVRDAPFGVIRACDYDTLRTWVEAVDRHTQAMIAQNKQDEGNEWPLMVRAKEGHLMPSPYLRVLNQSAEVLLRCASELGFTPASRPRLAAKLAASKPADGGQPTSPWAQLKLMHGEKPVADA